MKTGFLIDTNVLLRFLRLDDPHSTPKAMALFRRAQAGQIMLFVDAVIIAEAVWVLQKAFKTSRVLIAEKLIELLGQRWIVCEDKTVISDALDRYYRSSIDYIDCWLLARSASDGLPLETFDKRLKKMFSS